jgi:hypothetical protein
MHMTNDNDINKRQLAIIRKQISSPFGVTGPNKFIVFPHEANSGKTTTIIDVLNDNLTWNPSMKTLIVTKLINEGKEIAKSIPNALIANNKTLAEIDEDMLHRYSVVIITFRLYEILCKDLIRQEKYSRDRQTLIIDEELIIFKEYRLTERDLDDLYTILQEFNVKTDLDEIVNLGRVFRDLMANFKRNKNEYSCNQLQFFYHYDFEAARMISELQNYVEKQTFTDIYRNHLMMKNGIKTNKRNAIQRLENVKRFFNNRNVIFSNNMLHTYDEHFKPFTLRNNIMLDASASFNKVYEIGNSFKVAKEIKRIQDHSNWTIHTVDYNSSGSSKRRTDNYYDLVIDLINNYADSDDRILILGTEEDKKYLLENERFQSLAERMKKLEIANFQEMRGVNKWSSFNKCFVVHNPMLGLQYYPLLYMHLSGERLTDGEIVTKRIGHGLGFSSNSNLEQLRKTYIASNIYQGIKRVGRGKFSQDIIDIYIVNKDMDIIKMVTDQLLNCKIDRNVTFNKGKKKYDNSQRKKKSVAHILEEVLCELPAGKHFVKELLSQASLKHFHKTWDILKESDLMKSRRIELVKSRPQYFMIS